VYHRIVTGDVRPIHQHPRRIPLAKQVEVKEMLDDMQRHGVIEESDSLWSCPVILVRKKNGERTIGRKETQSQSKRKSNKFG
jgi:hypothetical protein